eukprot:3239945-Amphidinium_carterae.1
MMIGKFHSPARTFQRDTLKRSQRPSETNRKPFRKFQNSCQRQDRQTGSPSTRHFDSVAQQRAWTNRQE